MQHIITKMDVEVPGCPLFKKDTKVRVSDKIADMLVDRGLATYDQGEKPKTKKAKEVLDKPEKKESKKTNL